MFNLYLLIWHFGQFAYKIKLKTHASYFENETSLELGFMQSLWVAVVEHSEFVFFFFYIFGEYSLSNDDNTDKQQIDFQNVNVFPFMFPEYDSTHFSYYKRVCKKLIFQLWCLVAI